jgi:hypothetical protein
MGGWINSWWIWNLSWWHCLFDWKTMRLCYCNKFCFLFPLLRLVMIIGFGSIRIPSFINQNWVMIFVHLHHIALNTLWKTL